MDLKSKIILIYGPTASGKSNYLPIDQFMIGSKAQDQIMKMMIFLRFILIFQELS